MKNKFTRFSFFLIIYTLVIIVWGAWVRISGSGDGCGVHWPLCHGGLIPEGPFFYKIQTWIEYFHRIKSGLLGVFIIIQLVWCFSIFPKGNICRVTTTGTTIFMITEAILGAVLVLFGYVNNDESPGRVIVMAAHLINTLILLFFVVETYCFSKNIASNTANLLKNNKKIHIRFLAAFFIIILIGIAGAWASLASTLYPVISIQDGFNKDFLSSSHLAIRLRIIHPIFALLGGFIIFELLNGYNLKRFFILLICQILLGMATLFFLSPTWMKLLHLLLADLVWVQLCIEFSKISVKNHLIQK